MSCYSIGLAELDELSIFEIEKLNELATKRQDEELREKYLISALNAYLQGAGKKGQTFEQYGKSIGLIKDKKKKLGKVSQRKKEKALERAQQIRAADK